MTTTAFRNGSNLHAPRQANEGHVAEIGLPLSEHMEAKGTAVRHAQGDLLFAEGETSRGAHMVRQGRVKLTMNSADGKTLILKIAKPGDFLDLGSCVLGRKHEVTAEALEPSEVLFLPQAEFMRLMQQDCRVCLQAAEYLSVDFHEACRELTMLGLSRSAESKIAAFLLRIADERKPGSAVLKLTSTHEEMSQIVGTSRETVTRVLARLRRQRIIDFRGSNMTFCNVGSLRRLANVDEPGTDAQINPVAVAATRRSMQAGHAAY